MFASLEISPSGAADQAGWTWPLVREAYKRAQWTWGVTAWCLPSAALYGAQELLRVGADRYSARDFPALFRSLGPAAEASIGTVWARVANATPPDAPPGVRVHCLYGVGVRTPVHYAFPDGDLSAEPIVTYGDGDGQQDVATNGGCTRWRRPGAPEVVVRTFDGVDHDSILSDAAVLAYVLREVLVPVNMTT